MTNIDADEYKRLIAEYDKLTKYDRSTTCKLLLVLPSFNAMN